MKHRCLTLTVGYLVGAIMFFCPALLRAADDKPAVVDKSIYVEKFIFSGNSAISTADLGVIVKEYERKNLTFADIQKVADLITAQYWKRNHVTAKAFIPEQRVENNVIKIAVQEGKIGSVKIQGNHPYYSTAFIEKHFAPVQKESSFDQDSLERALLVLNDYPKLKVTAVLVPGSEPGTSDIVVTADNSLPVFLTLDYNNFGSRYVSGRSRFGATLDIGNLIQEGSILSIKGQTGERPDEFWYGRAFYSVPLNTLGTRLAAYYSYGNFNVGQEFEVLNINGKSSNVGLAISHPFIKKRLETLTAEFGFDYKDSKLYEIDDTLQNHDKVSSLKLGATYERTDTSGRTYASLYLTQGLGHALGGMKDGDPLASRTGGDNSFTKVNLNGIRLQKLSPSFYLVLKGSGQWADDDLVVSEQYFIGGQDSVRGYVQGERAGNDGYSVTGELRVSPFTNKEMVQFVAFVDNGTVYTRNLVSVTRPDKSSSEPNATILKSKWKDDHFSLTGAGGGVRLNLPYEFNIKADVGFPIFPHETLNGDHIMFYLQASKRF